MIIGVCGKKNSGKNITGIAIQSLMLENSIDDTECLVRRSIDEGWTDLLGSGWRIKSFAHKVKEIASILTGHSVRKFEDKEFKNYHSDTWGMTMREMLQKIGTDCMRDNLHSETWINALFSDYYPIGTDMPSQLNEDGSISIRGNLVYPKWIIVDARFPNETKTIQDRGGIVLKLLRNIDSDDNHPSEKSVEDIEPDYTIDNRNLSIKNNIIEIKKFLSDIHLL